MQIGNYYIFPDTFNGLSPQVTRRQKWSVSVQSHQSGGEVRMGYWDEPLWEWDISYDLLRSGFRNGRDYSELEQIDGLFAAANGSLRGFAFRDPDRNTTNFRTGIGQSDGVAKAFDIIIFLGAESFVGGPENIGFLDTTKAFNLYVNNSTVPVAPNDPTYGYTLSTTAPKKQQVVFNNTPAKGVTFYVEMSWLYYVRFQADSMDMDKFMQQLWELKKVTLASLRF